MSLILSGTDGLSDVDDTAATPAIRGTDANTGIFFPAADTIAFSEGGAECARFDSSGNLGIGTTTPAGKVSILQSASATPALITDVTNAVGSIWHRYTSASSVNQYMDIVLRSGNEIEFNTNSKDISLINNTTFLFKTNGNLGVNQASPSFKIDAIGSTTNGSGIVTTLRLKNGGASANDGAKILFTAGTSTDGAGIGSGGQALDSADLRFYAGGNTERARIDTSGNLLVGTTTQLGSARATFKAGSTLPGISIGMANSSGTYAAQIFFDGDGTDSGSIDVNNDANTTAYTTSSDYRLKINVQPIVNALDKVSQLNPVTWNWKKNPSLDSSGFIAHELQAVCPDAVTGCKDEVDAEGKPVYQGIDTSFLVATLTAAIQEQQALITTLTARITALESA